MGYRLSLEQLEAVRPYARQLSEQVAAEGSRSSDGAITLVQGEEFFPGASAVHVWQVTKWWGRRYLVDIVGNDGKVQTVRLKPKIVFTK